MPHLAGAAVKLFDAGARPTIASSTGESALLLVLRWQAGKQQQQQQQLQYADTDNFQWLLQKFTYDLPQHWTEQVRALPPATC
jgi:hypothetical protein